ncbi:MAG: hypothetical protein QM532_01875 [Cyanobium sp. MAG06]|nr:hypothetical protein [Cyanobium sp. MAG06]
MANKSAIDKEASEARKDGDKTRESLEKDTIDELTEKYNLLTEDIDSKINDITAIIDKIDQTPTPENEKKRSLLEREKNRLEKLKKSIDAAKAKLSEKNYSERFKKMEEKVKAMKEAMNRAEELLKKATILSSKEIKTEGPNAAVRFLKKFGNISTFSAEDKLEYVSTLAERAEIIRQVKGFYKSSLTEMYELGTAGLSPEDDKKRKGIIDQIKDIREKMYANKTRRFSMVLKNILKSPTLEIAAATEMGGIAGRRYMGAIEDSFSPNKEKRDAARGELMKGTALVGGAVGAVAGGLVISAMVGGGLGAGLALGVKAANDEYYKMSA